MPIPAAIRAGLAPAALGKGVGPIYVDKTAALDVDFEHDQAAFGGIVYRSIDAMVVAAGGTRSGQQITIPWTDNTYYAVVEGANYILAGGTSTLTEDQYILYTGDDTAANGTYFRFNYSNNQLNVTVIQSGTAKQTKSYGVFPRGSYIKEAHSINSQKFRCNLLGAVSYANDIASTTLPATTVLRIGSGPAGTKVWTGKIWRVTVYAAPQDDIAAVNTAAAPTWQCLCNGDSYEGGASNTTGLGGALNELGVRAKRIGVGGSTLAQQDGYLSAEVTATPASATLPYLWLDGDPNGFVDVATSMATVATMLGRLTAGTPYLLIGSVKRTAQGSTVWANIDAFTAAMATAYPGHVLDPNPYLRSISDPVADATDLANGCVGASLLVDGVHLKKSTWDLLGPYIRMLARGAGLPI